MWLRRPNWAQYWFHDPPPHPEGMGIVPDTMLCLLRAERELSAALVEGRYDDARRALDALEVWRMVFGGARGP